MKRAISVVLTIATLCSLFLPAITAPANAAAAGYTHTVYQLSSSVTFDGKWTTTSEWIDGELTTFNSSAFVDKFNFVDTSTVQQIFLVECFSDTTNDAGDYWQFCFDGDMSAGSTPQAGDVRIDIVGHSNVTFYQGTGTGWAPMTTPGSADFQWSNSISASPFSTTPHWILELMINKPAVGVGAEFWARIAVNDASKSPASALQAWPPTSRDVPNDWGDFPYVFGAIPEGSNFGIMALLSSVAVFVGFFGLRKRLRTNKWVQ